MKKALSVLLLLSMVIACFAFTTSAAKPGEPFSGKADDSKWYNGKDKVFEVDTADKLVQLFSKMPSGETWGTKTIKLTADIVFNEGNMSDWEKTPPKYNWATDVVDASGRFAGVFDGNGHTISGIYCNTLPLITSGDIFLDFDHRSENGAQYAGLFPGTNSGAVIKNLRITNSYFAAAYKVSALVGSQSGDLTIENVQIDNTKVFGTYVQMQDPTIPDEKDVAGPYEKHSATGGFVGMGNSGTVTVKNSVFQGTVVGGGRFVGGLFGNMNKDHFVLDGAGFIGVFESFYAQYYQGVNLFKENSGGLLGRTDDQTDTGVIIKNSFFIGQFKANPQSTTSGSIIGRCTAFTPENNWANDDAYNRFYDPSYAKNLAGENTDNGFNYAKLSVLTGKDSVSTIGLDDSVWTAIDGTGPMLSMFAEQAAEEVTTAPKTSVNGGSNTPAPSSNKPAPSTNNNAPASTDKGDNDAPASTGDNSNSGNNGNNSGNNGSNASQSAKPSTSKRPAAATGDVTTYMIAAVVISAAAAVVISKSRSRA